MTAVADLHCDSVKFLAEGVDLGQPNPRGHLDLPRLRGGGVGLQVFAAYVSPSTPEDRAFAEAAAKLDRIGEFVASSPLLRPVETAAESLRAIEGGKTGILKAVENGWAIEDSLKNLEELRRRKVRILTLVHSRHTHWASSCTGDGLFPPTGAALSDRGGGLSPFGQRVIAAMNELGIMVDLSHSSESAFWDALKFSKKPVIASHSCAYALCGSPRNLKDDQIKALGDCGGVVGVCFYPAFLHEAYRKAPAGEGDGSRDDLLRKRLVTVGTIADHIDYIVNLAGEDAAALGSDFDGVPSLPAGVGGCDFYPLLEEELVRRSYTPQSIAKFFNGNFLRVFREHDR
jgi:membrane dipeptidase